MLSLLSCDRLQRLETSMSTLLERLPSRVDEPLRPPAITQALTRDTSIEADVAPVMLIRDAATQSGATPDTATDRRAAIWSDASLDPAEIDHLLLLLVSIHDILRLLTCAGSASTTAGGYGLMSIYRLSS